MLSLMLSVTYRPLMLSVGMLNVVMLSVVATFFQLANHTLLGPLVQPAKVFQQLALQNILIYN